MKSMQRVLNKMPKKLSLGAMQNLEDKLKSLVDIYNELEEVSDKRREASIEFSKWSDKEDQIVATLEGEARVIKSELDDFKEKANDLGVEIDTNFITNGLEELENGIRANIAF